MNDEFNRFLIDLHEDNSFGEYRSDTSVHEVYQKLVSAKFRLINQARMIDLDIKNLDKILYKDLTDDE